MTIGPVAYKNLVASGAVSSGPGELFGVVLTAGADTATAIVYDNTSAAGTIVCKLSAVANTTAQIVISNGVTVGTGIYVALTGTAPSCTVFGG